MKQKFDGTEYDTDASKLVISNTTRNGVDMKIYRSVHGHLFFVYRIVVGSWKMALFPSEEAQAVINQFWPQFEMPVGAAPVDEEVPLNLRIPNSIKQYLIGMLKSGKAETMNALCEDILRDYVTKEKVFEEGSLHSSEHH